MSTLVVNCESSSLKYQLIDMKNESVLARGSVKRIGIEGSQIKHETINKEEVKIQEAMKDHKRAFELVSNSLTDKNCGTVAFLDEIQVIGHRVVHRGKSFVDSVTIDDQAMKTINDNVEVAPLHNPPDIIGTEACNELMRGVPQAAIFDTAFHQTMSEKNYIYALPYEYYRRYKTRCYGFHEASHEFTTEETAKLLSKPTDQMNLITHHSGNGSSITSVVNGKSYDTTMGFTPLEGLVTGTRTRDLDPAIIPFIMDKENMNPSDISALLNRRSGVLGISGVSSDFRGLEDATSSEHRARLALDVFEAKVRKYVGAYYGTIDHVDGVVFTAGAGGNSTSMRESIIAGLRNLGLKTDAERDNVRDKAQLISIDDSPCPVFVIPTNRELMIAKETLELTK